MTRFHFSISMPRTDYVPVIGNNFVWPIATLIAALNRMPSVGPNEVQASILENGHAASAIILMVVLTESAIGRAQYVDGIEPATQPLVYMKERHPAYLSQHRLSELFVIRDIIAHNHLWDAAYETDDQGIMRLLEANLREGFGDRKFRSAVNLELRTTRALGLNAFPTRICFDDVKIVLAEVLRVLEYLESLNDRYLQISGFPVEFEGKHMDLRGVLGEISSPSSRPA